MKAKFEEKIDAEIKTYQDNILKIREWKENAEVFAEVVSKFEHLDPRPSCGVGVSCLEGVVCHLESVKNLSDVAPLLKAMKEAGFERVGDMSTYEEIRRVHWEFKREGKPAVLTAFFTTQVRTVVGLLKSERRRSTTSNWFVLIPKGANKWRGY